MGSWSGTFRKSWISRIRRSPTISTKLKNEDLVRVQRESTFLRYSANTESLQELLSFLYSECCTRNQAVKPETIVQITR